MMQLDLSTLPLARAELVGAKQAKALTSDLLDRAAAVILNRVRTRFLAETDPSGKKWPPSKRGLQRRAKGDTGTLFDTGSLFHSIQILTPRATANTRVIGILPGSVNRRTGVDVASYGKKHQLGLDGMEKREFIGVSSSDEKVVAKVLSKLINDTISKGR